MLKLTTDRREASRGLSATAELRVIFYTTFYLGASQSQKVGKNRALHNITRD